MLVIRQEQIDTLIMGSDDEFTEFLVDHVKEEHPDLSEKYDDDTLREMVKHGINRAKSHQLSTAEDLTAFISIMFEIAPNFDEQPQIRAVLDDKKFPPESRIERMWTDVVSEEAWQEAEDNFDEKAWTFKG